MKQLILSILFLALAAPAAFSQSGLVSPTIRNAVPDLVDDFNDNILSASLWNSSVTAPNVISETGGQLSLRLIGGPGTTGLGISSKGVYNFSGKTLSFDNVQFTINTNSPMSEGMYVQITDTRNANNFVSIGKEQADLVFTRANNAVLSQYSSGGSIPANWTKFRVVHRQSDNAYLFYIWTGALWSLAFTSAAANWAPTHVQISVSAYEYHGSAGVQPWIIDNLIMN